MKLGKFLSGLSLVVEGGELEISIPKTMNKNDEIKIPKESYGNGMALGSRMGLLNSRKRGKSILKNFSEPRTISFTPSKFSAKGKTEPEVGERQAKKSLDSKL